jgi:integrase
MSMLKLRYVHGFVDKEYNAPYYYFRRGHMRVRLPGLPGSSEFMLAYQQALNSSQSPQAPIGIGRSKPGSVAASVARYFESQHFAQMAPSTQAALRSTLNRFRDQYGDHPINMPSKAIQIILSDKAPGVARNWFKHIRALCQFAMTVGLLDVDPTQGIKRPKAKTERRRPWTDAEIAQFEAKHPIGSKARLAFALGLYTLQRLGDVSRMGRQHIHKGRLEIRQQKTGTAVSVPIRQELQTIIDAAPSGMTFLLKDSGKSYASGELSTEFRKWSNEAGLPKGCTFHGLRATGCTIFADASCTAHEIAAWSGHKSLSEVERYTRSSNQKKLADQALARTAQA